jgi:hypothetical protein
MLNTFSDFEDKVICSEVRWNGGSSNGTIQGLECDGTPFNETVLAYQSNTRSRCVQSGSLSKSSQVSVEVLGACNIGNSTTEYECDSVIFEGGSNGGTVKGLPCDGPGFNITLAPDTDTGPMCVRIDSITYSGTVVAAYGAQCGTGTTDGDPNTDESDRQVVVNLYSSTIDCKGGTTSLGHTVYGETRPSSNVWKKDGTVLSNVDGIYFSQVTAGFFELTVTDAEGFVGYGSRSVTEPSSAVNAIKSSVTANSFILAINGGTGNSYTIIVKKASFTVKTLTGRPEGNHTITGLNESTNYSYFVTDVNGCETSGGLRTSASPVVRNRFYVTTGKNNTIDFCDGGVYRTQTAVYSVGDSVGNQNGRYLYTTSTGNTRFNGSARYYGISSSNNVSDWYSIIKVDTNGYVSNSQLKDCRGGVDSGDDFNDGPRNPPGSGSSTSGSGSGSGPSESPQSGGGSSGSGTGSSEGVNERDNRP